ncbi:MAG: hypothetical protein ACXAD7_29135, partial [Candidatus Kariarchaeaceae archaeon]|jgi:hypothetical protein
MLSLSVDPDADTISEVLDFKNEYSASWEFGLDDSKAFFEAYVNTFTFPVAFLFDPSGELVKTWSGITKTSKFLLDMSSFIDVDADYEDRDEFSIYMNNLMSNPLFLVVSSIIGLNIVYLIFRKVKPQIKRNETFEQVN